MCSRSSAGSIGSCAPGSCGLIVSMPVEHCTTVWPSAGLRAAASAATKPLAPVRTSTTGRWPKLGATASAISRLMMSLVPPGAKPPRMDSAPPSWNRVAKTLPTRIAVPAE